MNPAWNTVMPVAAPAPPSLSFTNSSLTTSVLSSVEGALGMCGVQSNCVSVSSVPGKESGNLTGMIGVHGKVSGFVTVNLPEQLAIKAVEGLTGDRYEKLTSEVVDGAGEITNLIVGGVKSALVSTEFAFSQITVPSVIIGHGYQIAYAKGLQFLSASFECEDKDAIMLDDRLLTVSVSLLKL